MNELHGMVVLYVEDDALTRQSVGNRLTRQGVEVLAAGSGEQALELVENRPMPVVAVLDVHLPGIDGIQTCEGLRKLYPTLPVVVCTAHPEEGLTERACACGIEGSLILRKPCRFQDLWAAILKAAGKTAG